MTETPSWRPISGFSSYDVSDDGRVRSWRQRARRWRDPIGPRRSEPIELTGSVTPFGYLAFVLRRDGDGVVVRETVHRLVAKAFLPPPLPGQTDVAHGDGDPGNNRASNLRWATHFENAMDMRPHGTMQDGERCVTAKITADVAMAIRAAVATGPRGTQRRLCEKYELSPAHVHRIATGKRWASLD